MSSHPSDPESLPPPDATPPGVARRRIRVSEGHLQSGVSVPSSDVATDGPPALPTPSTQLTVEVTDLFRHLNNTALALSQHVGKLTVGVPGPMDPSPPETRPLPMSQRRPQRIDPGRVNAKRSVRFDTSTDGSETPPPPAEVGPEADRSAPVEFIGVAGGEEDSTDATRAAAPSVPVPASVHDFSSGQSLLPFRPRQDYTPAWDNSSPRRSGGLGRWVMAAAAFALGATGGWVFQRTMNPTTGRSPASPKGPGSAANAGVDRPPANPAAMTKAMTLSNQALRAEKRGDVPRAVELLTEAGRVCPDFPGLRYQLALLALRLGETTKARLLLAGALKADEDVAAAHNLQSALARLENQTQTGFTELEAATRADPFNAKYFYYWAEALRRAGRLPEAAEKLEDALVRTSDPAEESLYQFKIRLLAIDLDREGEFTAELSSRLQAGKAVLPEWLLTSAALNLKRGNHAGAAADIERARPLLSPAFFSFLLNDQTFRDNAWRPELAPFYAGLSMATPPPAPREAPAPVSAPPATVPPGLKPSPSAVPAPTVAVPKFRTGS